MTGQKPEQAEWDGEFVSGELMALLGEGQEQQFDDLAELCAACCGTPISVISMVGRDTVYAKGAVGLATSAAPLGASICSYTVLQHDLLIVPDALEDPRFVQNPFVTGEPHLRFYAASPLYSSDGRKIGALCVIDTIPRALKPREAYALRLIARQVNALLELRTRRRQVEQAVESLRQSEALFRTLAETVPAPCYLKDREGRLQFYNQCFADRFQIAPETWLQKSCKEIMPAAVADQLGVIANEAFALGVTTHRTLDIELCAGDSAQWELHQTPCLTEHGEPLLAVVAIEAVSPALMQPT